MYNGEINTCSTRAQTFSVIWPVYMCSICRYCAGSSGDKRLVWARAHVSSLHFLQVVGMLCGQCYSTRIEDVKSYIVGERSGVCGPPPDPGPLMAAFLLSGITGNHGYWRFPVVYLQLVAHNQRPILLWVENYTPTNLLYHKSARFCWISYTTLVLFALLQVLWTCQYKKRFL